MTRTFAILGRGSNVAAAPAAQALAALGRAKSRSATPFDWHGSWTLALIVDAIGKEAVMLKFLGTTMGIIFLIGLLVVIGLFALIF
jgi:hypothetical protein